MAFGFMLCSEQNPIKICKHCGKVFYAKNPKAEYDSSQCRNQANVYKLSLIHISEPTRPY